MVDLLDVSRYVGEWIGERTCARIEENGRPLSRAKAQSWRLQVAMVEMAEAMRVMIMIAVMTLEPAYEFVVLKNTWTRGE